MESSKLTADFKARYFKLRAEGYTASGAWYELSPAGIEDAFWAMADSAPYSCADENDAWNQV